MCIFVVIYMSLRQPNYEYFRLLSEPIIQATKAI